MSFSISKLFRPALGILIASLSLGLFVGAAHTREPVVGKFAWESCQVESAPTARCGGIVLPRDYSRPNGRKVFLAAARVPATGVKRGTLFFNPGGPGSSGVQQVLGGIASDLPASVRRNFDFISWDPRGIGQSRPVIGGCRAVAERPSPLPATGFPTRSQWLSLLSQDRSDNRQVGLQCLRRNLAIAPHMGTNNVVRDLEMMRRAVGDRRLTFWGASYGSRIGYVYALRYPKRLRAILLDGPVDPQRGYREFARTRNQATDRALKVMATPQVRPAFAAEILATRDDLRVNGPVTEEGVTLTQWLFEGFVAGKTFAQVQWADIQEVIDGIKEFRAAEGPTEEALETIREAIEEVEEQSPFYPGIANGIAGDRGTSDDFTNRIINHLDYADSNIPSGVATRIFLNNVRNYPFAAYLSGPSMLSVSAGISSLKPDPVPLTRAPRFARIARRVENVLISGSTGDGATPAPWTDQMAVSFPRAGLVRFNGWQHVNWTSVESTCVNDPITNFILTGRKPSPLRLPLCPFSPPGPPAVP